jgi:hypothetical protein
MSQHRYEDDEDIFDDDEERQSVNTSRLYGDRVPQDTCAGKTVHKIQVVTGLSVNQLMMLVCIMLSTVATLLVR